MSEKGDQALAARLRAARERLGVNQKEMAARLGTGFRSLQDYEQGKVIPGGAVFSAYGRLGVDLNWLLLGDGGSRETHGHAAVSSNGDAAQRVWLSHIDPSNADTESRSSIIGTASEWLRTQTGTPDIARLMSTLVADDAMAPTLPKGSIVVFDTSRTRLDASGLYVLATRPSMMVRRVQITTEGRLLVRADAPGYAEEHWDADALAAPVAGKVVATLRALS